MKHRLGFKASLLTVSLLALGCKTARKETSTEKFYGYDLSQAKIEFTSYLFVTVPDQYQNSIPTLMKTDFKSEIDSKLNEQFSYLTSVLLNQGKFYEWPSAVYGQPKVVVTSTQTVKGRKDLALVNYTFSDKGAFSKAVVDSNSVQIDFLLPAMVDKFFISMKGKEDKNKCVSDPSEAYEEKKFWYYWKPTAEGCNFDKKEVVKVKATLTPIPATTNTKPFYAEIFGQRSKSAKKEVNVVWIFPKEDFMESYDKTLEQLKVKGFAEESSTEDLKKLRLKKQNFDLVFNFYSPMGDSAKYDEIAKKGLTTADIFVYSGHSSYGEFLSPKRLGLKAEDFDQDKAQIFLLSGCRTFNYYNAKYFALKPKKLNIITTTSQSTGFTWPSILPQFFEDFTSGKELPWKTLMDQMQKNEQSALQQKKVEGKPELNYGMFSRSRSHYSVNGDENNPR